MNPLESPALCRVFAEILAVRWICDGLAPRSSFTFFGSELLTEIRRLSTGFDKAAYAFIRISGAESRGFVVGPPFEDASQ